MNNSTILFNDILSLSDRQIKNKFLFLGEGIARKVYAINDDYVIKVAKGLDGYYQNQVEYYVYKNVDKYLLTFLCPIVAFTPRIVIMRRAKPLSKYKQRSKINFNNIRKEKDAGDALSYLSDRYYLYYNDIVCSTSWGKLNDTNVLIDYGCTNEYGDRYYSKLFHI
jgi:hypothetical protein